MGRKKKVNLPDPDGIRYDGVGRMKYHPEFHDNVRKRFTEEELCYLCKFYKHDGRRSVSFALGRPEGAIQNKYLELEKDGLIPYYQGLGHYV